MDTQKHLLHIFPTFAVGGSQIRFAQLARLHSTRYRHTVISLDGNSDMASRMGSMDVVVDPIAFDKTKTLQSWRVFRRKLLTLRPDALVTYNWGSIDWALVNHFGPDLPHLHIEDGFGREESEGQLRRRVLIRRYALSGRETNTVVPSQRLMTIAKSEWKLPSERLHYIPNGIDCHRFSCHDRAVAERPFVVGTVATLRPEKNIRRLIETFVAVAVEHGPGSLRLVIVGDGPERGALEQLAANTSVKDQIIFVGPSTQPEQWLWKMNVFVISSDTEQMPLGVLEAMASGLPIVSTAVGDVAQMVSPCNTGLVVPAGPGFEDALRQMIKDPVRALAIGRENALRAQQLFEEEVMAARYARIIG